MSLFGMVSKVDRQDGLNAVNNPNCELISRFAPGAVKAI